MGPDHFSGWASGNRPESSKIAPKLTVQEAQDPLLSGVHS